MENNNENSFKDRLVEELSYHGISYKEFANKVGISISTLNMYLYRNSIPSADLAVRMAEVLNTSVEYLIKGNYNKNIVIKNTTQLRNKHISEILSILETFSDEQVEALYEITKSLKKATAKR